MSNWHDPPIEHVWERKAGLPAKPGKYESYSCPKAYVVDSRGHARAWPPVTQAPGRLRSPEHATTPPLCQSASSDVPESHRPRYVLHPSVALHEGSPRRDGNPKVGHSTVDIFSERSCPYDGGGLARPSIPMSLTSKVAWNTAAQYVSRVFIGVAGLVSVAATTRYLPISQVAVLLTALAFVSLFQVAAEFGVTAAGARAIAKNPADERRIVGSIATFGTGFGAVIVVAGYTLACAIYGGSSHATLRTAILIMLVQLLVMGFKSGALAHYTAAERVAVSSGVSVIARSISLALVLTAVTTDGGLYWVAAAWASTAVIEAGILTVASAREIGLGLPRARAGLALYRVGFPLAIVLIINFVYYRVDLLILSLIASKPEVALYGISYKLVDHLLYLPSAFMLTLFPSIARLAPGSERLRELVQNAFTVMQLLVVPVLVATIYAPQILHAIAGPQYEQGATILRLLLISVGFSFFQDIFGNALVALGKQQRLVWVSLTTLGANIALNLALIPVLNGEGAAIALIVTEALSLGLTLRVYASVGGVSPRLFRPSRAVLAGAAMASVLLLVGAVGLGSVATLLLGGTFGAGAYAYSLRRLGGLPAFTTEFGRSQMRRFSRLSKVPH